MTGDNRFLKLPITVACRTDIGAVAKLLYASISDRVGIHGRAWPSIRRLAVDTGVGINAVLRGLRELMAADLLIVDRQGPGRSNVYRLGGAAETEALPFRERFRNGDGGAAETETVALPKRRQNQTKRTTPIEPDQERARPGDALWGAVCELFGLKPVTKSDRSRIGRIVRDLAMKGGTPDELRSRVARYRAEWPRCECTPESLCKHWDRFATERKPAGHAGRPDLASNERYGKLLTT